MNYLDGDIGYLAQRTFIIIIIIIIFITFIVAPCISQSHLISAQTNAHT